MREVHTGYLTLCQFFFGKGSIAVSKLLPNVILIGLSPFSMATVVIGKVLLNNRNWLVTRAVAESFASKAFKALQALTKTFRPRNGALSAQNSH